MFTMNEDEELEEEVVAGALEQETMELKTLEVTGDMK